MADGRRSSCSQSYGAWRAGSSGAAGSRGRSREDLLRVRETYARLGVEAEVASFFADLPARIEVAAETLTLLIPPHAEP